ncbi:MAG TPA: helix-turn-helix transcriptional regulator [Candidatus Thermoplasmatota archaeon]|jgi:transcriptional regulator with XRE-family HTH domain
MPATKLITLRTDRFEIGQRLRRLRLTRRARQRTVAAAIGVSKSSISQIENGSRTLDIDKLVKFCWYFERSPSFILLGLPRNTKLWRKAQ